MYNAVFRIHRLTWHNGAIPENEIWLKLGGDKGGGTFKFCFQHLNVECPNSPDNTCVFALFEAPDSYTNLRICFERYKKDIDELQSRTWRYGIIYTASVHVINYMVILFNRGKKVRIFLCGDYEFLCRLYGLSGASGLLRIVYIHML